MARQADRKHIPVAIRREVYERDEWTCQLCFAPVVPGNTERYWWPSLDHLVPWSKGGTDTAANLQLAHYGCNTQRQAKPLTTIPV